MISKRVPYHRKGHRKGGGGGGTWVNFCWVVPLATQSSYPIIVNSVANKPFPSSKNPQIQNEAKSTTFLVKVSFISMRMKNHFHIRGRALNLALIQRPRKTRKMADYRSHLTVWQEIFAGSNFCDFSSDPQK